MSLALEWAAAALVLSGAGFTLIAALGVVRFPNALSRMHAAAKAGPMGAGLLLLAVALFGPGEGAAFRALATLAFLCLTTPVATHALGRCAAREPGPLLVDERP